MIFGLINFRSNIMSLIFINDKIQLSNDKIIAEINKIILKEN